MSMAKALDNRAFSELRLPGAKANALSKSVYFCDRAFDIFMTCLKEVRRNMQPKPIARANRFRQLKVFELSLGPSTASI
jgi:hypothetical protein